MGSWRPYVLAILQVVCAEDASAEWKVERSAVEHAIATARSRSAGQPAQLALPAPGTPSAVQTPPPLPARSAASAGRDTDYTSGLDVKEELVPTQSRRCLALEDARREAPGVGSRARSRSVVRGRQTHAQPAPAQPALPAPGTPTPGTPTPRTPAPRTPATNRFEGNVEVKEEMGCSVRRVRLQAKTKTEPARAGGPGTPLPAQRAPMTPPPVWPPGVQAPMTPGMEAPMTPTPAPMPGWWPAPQSPFRMAPATPPYPPGWAPAPHAPAAAPASPGRPAPATPVLLRWPAVAEV